jgi:membrane protease subunit HflK
MSWDWEKLKEQQQKMGGGGVPPQMDELVKRFKGFKLPGGPLLIALLFVALVVYSAVYTVKQDEVGVIQYFGRYVRTTQPGLNFKLPVGIEKVTKVNVKRINTEEFGFRSSEGVSRRQFAPAESSTVALMLTGDLNVAVVPWIVQYRIKDPYNFLFKVRDVRRLLTDMSEATMRLVVGDRSIDEVISKRGEIAIEAREILQRELDLADSGIHVVPVQPSFNEVNQAEQEKEQMIFQAREEYNKAIPAARGQAERVIREAEGYALERINRAKGDSARFTAVYREFAKAQDVTKRRLYLEALSKLLPKLGAKYLVDSDQKNLLPLLNLGQQKGVGVEK